MNKGSLFKIRWHFFLIPILIIFSISLIYLLRNNEIESPLLSIEQRDDFPCVDTIYGRKLYADFQLYSIMDDIDFHEVAVGTIVFAQEEKCPDISSWQELIYSDKKILFPFNEYYEKTVYSSFSYALTGNSFMPSKFISHMKRIYASNDNTRDNLDTIYLCPDYMSVSNTKTLKKAFIVPKDGTISFKLGFIGDIPNVSNRELENALIEKGYRLLDGRCKAGLYPEKSEYESATFLNDFNAFNETYSHIEGDIKRKVLALRLYTAATCFENILISLFISSLIICWVISAIHRMPYRKIHFIILSISGFLITWILISMFKYLIPSITLTRYLWYSYYIFILILPLYLFLIVLSIEKRYKNQKIISKPFILAITSYIILLTMVFTNDCTRYVFNFDINGNWSDEYSYEFGYYIIFTYCLLLLIISIYKLLKNTYRSPKKHAFLLPFITAAFLIIYNAGYALGIKFFRDSNLTHVFTVLSLLFLESAIQSGLIPSNTHYSELFKLSLLEMRILDNNGNIKISGENPSELSSFHKNRILEAHEKSFYINSDILLHNRKIQGGFVIWEENRKILHELDEIIKKNVEQIRKANMLLIRESDLKKEKISFELKRNLFYAMEVDIKEKTDRLSEAVKKLKNNNDYEKQLAFIAFLLCHIKRHCNLFLIAKQQMEIVADELSVYLDELSEFAEYSSVNSLVRSGLKHKLDIRISIILYDFYFTVLSWAIEESQATLIGILEEDLNKVSFSIMSSHDIPSNILGENLKKAIKALNGYIETANTKDSERISLTFPVYGGTK